jgi:PhzF family phenazine biosynthesis protein
MQLPIYQVDAFSSRLFAGNPAAVCPLEQWLPDEVMQSIAAENNLAETAFFAPDGNGYRLRWFTPAVEIDLCGHATLASAWVIMNCLNSGVDSVSFQTRSGELIVRRNSELYSMDFPSRPPQHCQVHPRLIEALGTVPLEVLAARDYFVVYQSEEQVLTIQPNMELLSQMDRSSVIITAPGIGGVDFVSRFFAPALGVPEDPVTGSAHCSLIPYWSRRFNKKSLKALQLSKRGGEVWCEDRGERVTIAGNAALYLEGTIRI